MRANASTKDRANPSEDESPSDPPSPKFPNFLIMPMSLEQANIWMNAALAEARVALLHGDVPIGAIVVHEGQIIARAHNEVEKLHDASAHAEMLALKRASQKLGRWRLDDCTLVVTLEPCAMCAGSMVLSRVKTLVFGAADPRMGAVGSLFNLAEHSALPHQLQVYSGVCESECSTLLTDFFRKLR